MGGERREREMVSEGFVYTRECERVCPRSGAAANRSTGEGGLVKERRRGGVELRAPKKQKMFFVDGVRAACECVFDRSRDGRRGEGGK